MYYGHDRYSVAIDDVMYYEHDRYSVAIDDVMYYDMIVTVWP